VRVAGHSLRVRLVFLTSLFILTSLFLGWKRPRLPPPGQSEGGPGSGRYCPKCYRPLKRRPEAGNALFCRFDGEISEADALTTRPQQRP
jgi:hypothetical protein